MTMNANYQQQVDLCLGCCCCLYRTITLNTEDGNFSVSMSLYKDEAFEKRWTTVPSLTLDEDIFVKVFMVNDLSGFFPT